MAPFGETKEDKVMNMILLLLLFLMDHTVY